MGSDDGEGEVLRCLGDDAGDGCGVGMRDPLISSKCKSCGACGSDPMGGMCVDVAFGDMSGEPGGDSASGGRNC